MIVFPVVIFGVVTCVTALVWWQMARRPGQWSAMVERENNFWRDRRIISAAFAEKIKRWETGRLFQAVAAAAACIGLIGLLITGSVLVKVLLVEHHKLRMPFNPALTPPKKPAANRPPAPAQPPKRRP